MNDLSNNIIQKRKSLKLSIADVSEATKIRSHIIEEIEKGNLDVLPSVYMKAFLKTYCSFLKIPLSQIPESLTINENIEEISNEDNSDLNDDHTDINDDKHKKIAETSEIKSNYIRNEPESYKELFKKKPQTTNKLNHINIAIYSTAGFVAILLIYFSFFYSSDKNSENDNIQSESTLTIKDTSEKKEESKNLFNYFNSTNDSLQLIAEANGESWIRIEIDGKKVDEVLMQPGEKKKWVSENFFLLTQGNVGSVTFKLNGKELKPFGNPGTVAKNIKITADTVMNTTPINKNQARTKVSRKKKEKKGPKLIEPSPIPNSTFLEKKKKDTFRL